MGENERVDEVRITQILKGLATTPVPAALEARILADFERVVARRSPWLAGLLARTGERLWPGAPVWQPVSVLALSLVVGLTAGAILPSPATTTSTSDQMVVAALDTAPDIDLDRDQ